MENEKKSKLGRIMDILLEPGNEEENSRMPDVQKKSGVAKARRLTLTEISDYYYSMKRKYPQIHQCVISIENISRVGVEFSYRLEQYFLDISGELIYSDETKKSSYGRVVLALEIDNELAKFLEGKSKVTLTL